MEQPLGLPNYVRPFLERVEKSQRLFENNSPENRHDNDDGSECHDDDESVIIGNPGHEYTGVLDFDELDRTNVSLSCILYSIRALLFDPLGSNILQQP